MTEETAETAEAPKARKKAIKPPPKAPEGAAKAPGKGQEEEVLQHFETVAAAKSAAERGGRVPIFVLVDRIAEKGKALPGIVNVTTGAVEMTTDHITEELALDLVEAMNGAVDTGAKHGRAAIRNQILGALGFKMGEGGQMKIDIMS